MIEWASITENQSYARNYVGYWWTRWAVMGFRNRERSLVKSLDMLICCCCCSVPKLCLTLCDPVDCSTPDFPVLHYLLELAQTHAHWVNDAIQPSHPLLFLSSIFPSVRVFSNELALCMRWPKIWSFSFSIIPSKEIPGLVSFKWTGWISLQSRGISRVFSNTTV